MVRLAVRRAGQLIPTLFGLSILVFVWVRALPGDPAAALLAGSPVAVPEASAKEAVTEVRRLYRLDRPIHEQYVAWLGNAARLELGRSITTRQDVRNELLRRFPATAELTLGALVVAVGVGLPLGYLAARRARSWLDHICFGTSLLAVSIPMFFLAFLLKYVFAVKLGWLPSIGRADATHDVPHPTGFYVIDAVLALDGRSLGDSLRHLVLPAVSMGLAPAAYIARVTRASVLAMSRQPYVNTAHAKGLSDSTVGRRHVLRNALLPVITIIGLTAGVLLEGAALVEIVFSWGGVGSLLYQAVTARDYPVLQAGILLVTVLLVLLNLLLDLIYARVDPRVRVA